MPLSNPAYRLRGASVGRRLTAVSALIAVAAASSIISMTIRPDQDHLVGGWTVSGFTAAALVVAARRELPGVSLAIALVIGGLVSGLGHGPVGIVAAAAANLLPGLLVRVCVNDRSGRPRLFTLRDVMRFAIGVVTGALAAGVVVAAGRVLQGHSADAATAGLETFLGSASAVVLVVPFVLISRRRRTVAGRWSVLASAGATLLAATAAFWPAQEQSFTFLPLPFLAWAAFSLAMPAALLQAVAVNGVALTSILFWSGPFSIDGVLAPQAMLEIYAIVTVAMVLLIAAIRNERDSNAEQHAAAAELLRQGFLRVGNGYAVLRDTEYDTFDVLDVNAAALRLLPAAFVNREGRCVVEARGPLHPLCTRVTHSHGRTEATFTAAQGGCEPVHVIVEELQDTVNDRVLLATIVDLSAIEAAAHAADEQLRRQRDINERLRLTNESHDLFIASVTHELRTPLTSMIGYTDEALDLASDAEQRNYLEIVQRNGERLQVLVQDVLDTTRARDRVDQKDVDVSVLVRECLADIGPQLTERGQWTRSEVADGLLVRAIESDLRRALLNVLVNATKFSPRETAIEVRAARRDRQVVITVTDRGPGMPDADIEHAFDRFYRSRDAVAQGIPGTGLGLGIARDIVEQCGGELRLRNAPPRGLAVTFTMPAATEAP